MYTNIDGFISEMLEMRDYALENKLDVVCITEPKLNKDIQINYKEQRYDVSRRERKGKVGGGVVLIMVCENLYREEAQYGDGPAEVLSLKIRSGREKRKIIVSYVPP